MKIDSDVAVPAVASGGKAKYPFRYMDIGDSIFAPEDEGMKMWGAARTFAYRNRPVRVVARMVVEHGVRGVRVWRVE